MGNDNFRPPSGSFDERLSLEVLKLLYRKAKTKAKREKYKGMILKLQSQIDERRTKKDAQEERGTSD